MSNPDGSIFLDIRTASSLDARDKNAPVDFAFDNACPGLSIGLVSNVLRWAG